MDDPLLVRRFERVGDLSRDRQRFVERNRAASNPHRQIVAFDELHDEGVHAAAIFESVDRRDVRMIERGEDLRFALKAREAIGDRPQRLRAGSSWRRHDSALCRCPIHLAHPAFADLGDDFVDAKASAEGESQAV